jgi:hypothetical protein
MWVHQTSMGSRRENTACADPMCHTPCNATYSLPHPSILATIETTCMGSTYIKLPSARACARVRGGGSFVSKRSPLNEPRNASSCHKGPAICPPYKRALSDAQHTS